MQSSWTQVDTSAEGMFGMLCAVPWYACNWGRKLSDSAYPYSTIQAAFISNQHVLKSRMTDLWEHPLQAAELWLHGRILAG